MHLYLVANVHQTPHDTDLFVALDIFNRLFWRRTGSYSLTESDFAEPKGFWQRLTRKKPLVVERIEGISDILSLKRVEKRLNDVCMAFPGCKQLEEFYYEGDPKMTRTKMTISEMKRAAQMLKECSYTRESELNHHQKSCLSAAVQALNLYCLMQSVNIFDVKPPKSLPEKLVKRVLGTLPHGMRPEFYIPFLYTASEKNQQDFSLIHSIFWEVVKNSRQCKDLDEVCYTKEQFKELAKKILKTPASLIYSPDLLRICLELAESKKSTNERAKLPRETLVENIQKSIDSVSNTPSADRVQRQINDLCLIVDMNKKLSGSMTELKCILFDGSEAAIDATSTIIRNHCDKFREIGSAPRKCYIKLVEELNLFCLKMGRSTEPLDRRLDSRDLPQTLVVKVLGSELAECIKGKGYEQYLVTAGLPGSNSLFIKRALQEKLGNISTVDSNADTDLWTNISHSVSSVDSKPTWPKNILYEVPPNRPEELKQWKTDVAAAKELRRSKFAVLVVSPPKVEIQDPKIQDSEKTGTVL